MTPQGCAFHLNVVLFYTVEAQFLAFTRVQVHRNNACSIFFVTYHLGWGWYILFLCAMVYSTNATANFRIKFGWYVAIFLVGWYLANAGFCAKYATFSAFSE